MYPVYGKWRTFNNQLLTKNKQNKTGVQNVLEVMQMKNESLNKHMYSSDIYMHVIINNTSWRNTGKIRV